MRKGIQEICITMVLAGGILNGNKENMITCRRGWGFGISLDYTFWVKRSVYV
ncbi:MAG: hypothetical protein PHH82_04305 [Candidatus ainarchaeum sp.]|nr:hypothetical protein [Candidatus ainarchaeum sp.]